MLVDWQKLHDASILLCQGWCEDILGRPEDQLRTPASVTPDTKVVKIRLKLGNFIARGLNGRNTGGVVLTEIAVVGGVIVRFIVIG
jgi:hypothetical protein